MRQENRDQGELIDAYLEGRPEAVATMELWIARAARTYRRRLGNRWEDVLQEIHLEVYRLLERGQFRGDAHLRTYLWRVVGHTCLDQIRAHARKQVIDLEDSNIRELSMTLSAERDKWGESRDLVNRVLRQTSDECRRLWAMILAGHSYSEMSADLKVAEGALRVRVMRCRRRALEVRRRLLAAEPL